ncbi:MAG: hypothetical protein Q8O04_08455 [Deltaproteobacteria bacterium]|nr:hypothetical protein [Deltaproteobacteria bacterium]
MARSQISRKAAKDAKRTKFGTQELMKKAFITGGSCKSVCHPRMILSGIWFLPEQNQIPAQKHRGNDNLGVLQEHH